MFSPVRLIISQVPKWVGWNTFSTGSHGNNSGQLAPVGMTAIYLYIYCVWFFFFSIIFVSFYYALCSYHCSKETPEEWASGWSWTGGARPDRRGSTRNCSSGAQRPVLQWGQLTSTKQWTKRAPNMDLRTALRLILRESRATHHPCTYTEITDEIIWILFDLRNIFIKES